MLAVKHLGDIVTFVGGGTPDKNNPDYWDGDIPWASVKDLNCTTLCRTADMITEEGVRNSATKVIPKGNVIIATRMALGRAVINNIDVAINQDLKALYCSDEVYCRYLYHFINAKAALIDSLGKGATVKGVTLGALREIDVPLPPLTEQKRIAAILDKAEAIRGKRQEAFALSDNAIQSAYAHVCGPQNPSYMDWRSVRIEELAAPKKNSMRTGPFGSALKHSEFVDKGIAVLGIDNAVNNFFSWKEHRYITSEKYKEMVRYTVFPGDVIITIMGTTGRSAVVPDDVPTAISTKHLATITPNRDLIHPEYLSNAMHRDSNVLRQFSQRNQGAIMSGLNLKLIKEIEVRLPPLHVQKRFVRILKKIRAIQSKWSLGKATETLFSSLQQRAFRGDL